MKINRDDVHFSLFPFLDATFTLTVLFCCVNWSAGEGGGWGYRASPQ